MPRSDLIVAIDIGSSKITTLVGQYFPEEERVNVIGVSTVTACGIRKGQIVNIEQTTESLVTSVEAAERMAGFNISEALVGISAPYISSLNSQGVVAVADPKGEITQDDIERVIEAAKALSLPSSSEILHTLPRQFKVDGQGEVISPIGMTGVRLEVEAHIVTAASSSLKNLRKCSEEAGVQVLSFIFSGFAAAEAVLTPTEKELGVILIDIGDSITTMVIYSEGAPCYSTVIPIGSRNVTNDLAIGLRLPLDEAEKLKVALEKFQRQAEESGGEDEISLKKMGVSFDDKRKISLKTAIDGIVGPRLAEIFAIIREEIKASGFGGSTPAGVILTGGGAKTVGIKYHCQKILGLPARIGMPEKLGGIADEVLSPEFSSAVGLLLYGIREKRKERVAKSGSFNFGRITGRIKIGKKFPFKSIFGKMGEILKPLLP